MDDPAIFDEYAYDEALDSLPQGEFNRRMQNARGLKKLKFVRDPQIRQQLYRLWFVCHKNETDPRIRSELAARRVEEQERALRRLSFKALHGQLGNTQEERDAARQIAERLMPLSPVTGKRQEDPLCMQRLGEALRHLHSEYKLEPTGGFDQMGGE